MIAGRVEAAITVPPGGAALSASTGAQTSAVTVTVPAGTYYWTQAGGIASLPTTLQALLNQNVRPYPENASAMQTMLGYGGSWATGAGWLMQDASGNPVAAFGAPALTAVSTPTYQNPGPATGKYAIGFDSAADALSGGNVFDVGAADDLILAMVVKLSSVSGNVDLAGKGYSTGTGYLLVQESATPSIAFYVKDGVDTVRVDTGATPIVANSWYCVLAVLDRTNNLARIAAVPLSGSSSIGTQSSTTLVGSCSNASNYLLGNQFYGAGSTLIAAHYVVKGAGVAGNLVANLGTAAANFAAIVNSVWAVAVDTANTGRVTISHSGWPAYVQFTNTQARDAMGFTYDFDYPQAPAQVTAAMGGTWTAGAGYLCNEAAGNLVPVFGSPTLTATSLTYSSQGARGGADKAFGFDAATDNANGGDVFDINATDDFVLVWVGYLTGNPAGADRGLFTKFTSVPLSGWFVQLKSTGGAYFGAYRSDTNLQDFITADVAFPTKEWHIGMAVVDRSTGKARLGVVGLRTGTVTVSAEVTAAAAPYTNAADLRLGRRFDNGSDACTELTTAAFYIVSGAGAGTGLSAGLSSALSSFAAYMKAQTGLRNAGGLWLPDCTLELAGDVKRAPIVSDKRQSASPTAYVTTLVGNNFRRHKSARWSNTPIGRTWEAEATYAHASWEWFFKETQLGLGSTFFPPGSLVQIYDHAGTLMGIDENGVGTAGWAIIGLDSCEPEKAVEGWTGQWNIVIPTLIAQGS